MPGGEREARAKRRRRVGAGGAKPQEAARALAATALKIYKVKKTRARVTVVDNAWKALLDKALANPCMGDVTM